MIPSREAIGTLDLVKYITKQYSNIKQEEIVLYIDNKISLKEIHKIVY